MQFAALANAYPATKATEDTSDVYYGMLKDIPEKRFAEAIKEAIATIRFFPTIAELGELCYPTIEQLGPYNSHRESIVTRGWRSQIAETKPVKQIESPRLRSVPQVCARCEALEAANDQLSKDLYQAQLDLMRLRKEQAATKQTVEERAKRAEMLKEQARILRGESDGKEEKRDQASVPKRSRVRSKTRYRPA